MTRISSIAAIVVATLIPLVPAAHGETGAPVCAERMLLISQLEKRHGEVRRSVGLQQDTGVIETFANAETGTWTIIITLPTGLSCLVAVGENWREDRVVAGKSDEAA